MVNVIIYYPDEAVESVYGGECKVQAEKVEGEDADYISLHEEKKPSLLLLNS